MFPKWIDGPEPTHTLTLPFGFNSTKAPDEPSRFVLLFRSFLVAPEIETENAGDHRYPGLRVEQGRRAYSCIRTGHGFSFSRMNPFDVDLMCKY
jgi:hypothetical protein